MDIAARAVYNLLTLYMILILLRWFGAYIGLEMAYGRLRWIPKVTDPVLDRLRAILPNMGPFDFAPIAMLFFVWLFREISVGMMLS